MFYITLPADRDHLQRINVRAKTVRLRGHYNLYDNGADGIHIPLLPGDRFTLANGFLTVEKREEHGVS